jgi:hypothetical protein
VDASVEASTTPVIGPLQTLKIDDVPAGVVVPRPVVKVVGWTDANGDNRVVLSNQMRIFHEDADPVDVIDFTITHAVWRNRSWVVLLTKKKHVDCGGGGAHLVLSNNPSLTDIDHDGVAELHIPFEIPCIGDPTRAIADVVVIENGK